MTDEPTTPAIDALEAAGVPFRVVRTAIAHDAEESAAFQGIELGSLLRSILVRRAADDYVFVLVPGGRRFDWPKLRAHLGTNRLSLPDQDEAKAETGYERGAITPFGACRPWPVIVGRLGRGAATSWRSAAAPAASTSTSRPATSSGRPAARCSTSRTRAAAATTTTDDGRSGPAGRDPRRRLLDGPGRPVLHDAAGGPRRGRGQGRAARGRHDARLGPALGRRRGRRDADRRLLPRRQPQQALDPPRPQAEDGPRGPAPAARATPTCSSRTTASAGSSGWGSATTALAALNPGLVHLAITGFGHGRARTPAKPGYDFVIQAVGGLMSITGATDADGGGPTKVGVAISDVVSGLFGAVSILAGAGRAAGAPGSAEGAGGQRIDVSLLESTLAVLVNQAQNAFVTGRRRGGSATPTPTSSRTRRSRRPTASSRSRSAASASGRGCARPSACPELAADPRFATNGDRVVHRADLRPILARRFASGRRRTGSRASTRPGSRAARSTTSRPRSPRPRRGRAG